MLNNVILEDDHNHDRNSDENINTNKVPLLDKNDKQKCGTNCCFYLCECICGVLCIFAK